MKVETRKLHIETGAVYSRQEAAEALGISLSTLKRLIKKRPPASQQTGWDAAGVHHRREHRGNARLDKNRKGCLNRRQHGNPCRHHNLPMAVHR